jgi:signal transduction histidine kinase
MIAGRMGPHLEREAAAHDGSTSGEVARGIAKVATGEHAEFALVRPSFAAGEVRWWRVRATRFLDREEARVMIVQDDVTDWKRAARAVDEITEHLLVAQDEERRRIARELHDATVPNIVGLSLEMARLLPRLPAELRALGDECAALCEQALRELRTASFLLHPPQLARVGLVAALRWLADGFAKRSGIALSLATSGEGAGRLPPGVELALYRVAQEALVNVHRHTASRMAHIALALEADEVRLSVSDEGGTGRSGFDPEGVGIAGMRERVEALGGRLEIRTSAAGTTVTATVRNG